MIDDFDPAGDPPQPPCPWCGGLMEEGGGFCTDCRTTGAVLRELVRLRSQNHELKGLVETVCDAWESGIPVGNGMTQRLWLPPAWYKRAKEVTK